jgi:hypothetical protein
MAKDNTSEIAYTIIPENTDGLMVVTGPPVPSTGLANVLLPFGFWLLITTLSSLLLINS